jgi:hypothetical protein
MVVNQIDPESHIVAAIGLPLLFENKVWVVHSITDSRVVLKHGQARRIVF